MKRCPRCKKTKKASAFNKRKASADGLQPYCRICTRAYQNEHYTKNRAAIRDKVKRWRMSHPDHGKDFALRRDHGITLKDYREMLAAQGGRCAICRRKKCPTGKQFAVDHDHETGQIRGLFCVPCNRGIGNFGDSPRLLEDAARYIRLASAVEVP